MNEENGMRTVIEKMRIEIEGLRRELFHMHLWVQRSESKANYYQSAFLMLFTMLMVLIGHMWETGQLKAWWL